MNISSAVVNARPGTVDAVRARLAAIKGVEVHVASEQGKLIVTIESDDDHATTDTFEAIGHVDDVMSVAMVYHQVESDPEMDISVEAGLRVESQILGDTK